MTTRRREWVVPPSGDDGMSVIVETIAEEPPDLTDWLPRLKDMRSLWAELIPHLLDNPEHFANPQRMVKDPMPKPGRKGQKTGRIDPDNPHGYGPGFMGRGKASRTKRKLKVKSSRPAHPAMGNNYIDKVLVPGIEDHILTGKVQRDKL